MAQRQHFFGVESHEEHQKAEFLRDIRPTGTRLAEALLGREAAAVVSVVGAVCMLVVPWTCLLLMPVLVVLHARRMLLLRRTRMPMRMPATWDGPDWGDNRPDGGFNKARGTFYLGNDLERNAELWIAKEDVLTHTLVLGTTGAGKTETLVSLAFNYLARGSGLLYVDPKAAPRLAVQIYTLCRIMGRDDDFLLLSYMADKKAHENDGTRGRAHGPMRQSNTQNPFAVGTANELTQLLYALMPEEGSGNAIFSNNAQTLISGLLFVLVELRDRGESPLSIDIIRKYLMSLPDMDQLARRTDLAEQAILALRAGLATVGWDMSKPLAQQPKNFAEQYGYARAYFGRALSLLVDNYGRIFKTTHGEIDAVDVITSRRIYVTLIPSMDKDPKELKNLGQICLSSIRNACAVGLGGRVQGKVSDVLGSLPTDARTPFGVVVDEYAAIETPGFEILLTQGRGLGIAVTVASQDFAGIRRASENAAEQIVSNCKVKCFMCTEDPRQTFELVKALAGEAFVHRTTGWSKPDGNPAGNFVDDSRVSVEKLARVDFRDLQKQVEGQMTIFFKGQMIRARSFYASPPLDYRRQVRLNCHLRLQQTPDAVLKELSSPVHRLESLIPELLPTKPADTNCMRKEALVPELEAMIALYGKLFAIPELSRQHAALAALLHNLVEERDEAEARGEAPVEKEHRGTGTLKSARAGGPAGPGRHSAKRPCARRQLFARPRHTMGDEALAGDVLDDVPDGVPGGVPGGVLEDGRADGPGALNPAGEKTRKKGSRKGEDWKEKGREEKTWQDKGWQESDWQEDHWIREALQEDDWNLEDGRQGAGNPEAEEPDVLNRDARKGDVRMGDVRMGDVRKAEQVHVLPVTGDRTAASGKRKAPVTSKPKARKRARGTSRGGRTNTRSG